MSVTQHSTRIVQTAELYINKNAEFRSYLVCSTYQRQISSTYIHTIVLSPKYLNHKGSCFLFSQILYLHAPIHVVIFNFATSPRNFLTTKKKIFQPPRLFHPPRLLEYSQVSNYPISSLIVSKKSAPYQLKVKSSK